MTDSAATEPLPTVAEARAELQDLRRRSLLYAGIVFAVAFLCAFLFHRTAGFVIGAALPLLYVGAASARLRGLRDRTATERVAESDLDLNPAGERLMTIVGIVLAVGMLLAGIVVCAVIVMHT